MSIPKCSNGYCEVPGGSFQMGSTKGDSDERPVQKVTMTGFLLGETEVSVGDYKAYLAKTTSGLPNFAENQKGDDYPVVGLTFDEKRAYCQAQGGDLPTAAQLHYASRNDDQYNASLIIRDNGFQSTEPINSGYINDLGIYNLLGNVWESALDACDYSFYLRMPSRDPYNPLTDQSTQLEEFSGGSFSDLLQRNERRAFRFYNSPGVRFGSVGFRCALALPQEPKK